uniref:Uncharacterized protein n=1 Tax=Schizaphis graminum TaxID=13262 RepID=A0A2S2NA24_SCHGA
MIDVDTYRFNNSFQDLSDAMKTLKREFQENCTDLYTNWYGEIKSLLSKKKATDGVVLKRIPEFLKCIMYTISLTIERIILKSLDCVVQLFGNLKTTPKLNVKLHFVGSKCISMPRVEEIIEKYCSALDLV